MMRGILIKESLSDELVLDLLSIEKVEIWKAENHTVSQPKYWTAISFYTNSEQFLDALSKALKEEWYVDMNTDLEKIIVFKDKVIQYKYEDLIGNQKAIDYCREIGVPESQIDWPE